MSAAALREAPSGPLIDKSFDADVFLAPNRVLHGPGPTLCVRECGFRRVWTHRLVRRSALRSRQTCRSTARGLHEAKIVTQVRTVGSQNFTSYARKSKETTAAPSVDLAGSNVLATLAQWYKAAEPVELEDVERLLSLLDEPLKKFHAAHADLMDAFHRSERERAVNWQCVAQGMG
jgi:hypothetical protein